MGLQSIELWAREPSFGQHKKDGNEHEPQQSHKNAERDVQMELLN